MAKDIQSSTAPTAKKFTGAQAKALGFDASVHKIGLGRLNALKTYESESKEVLKEEGNIQKLYSYVFGESDENPLEAVSKKLQDANDAADNKLQKLADRIQASKRGR